MYRRLAALAPKDPRGTYLAGVARRAQGKRAEARKEFEAALALLKDSAARLPCNTMVQYHLGMVSAQLGDTEAARQAFSIAAASATPFPFQDAARKALAALK